MNWNRGLLVCMLFLLIGCNSEIDKKLDRTDTFYFDKHIASIDEFSGIHEVEAEFIDIRKEDQFLEGHIPNARNIWRDQIEDPTYPYGGMMISKDSLDVLLANKGIQKDHRLIIYDDRGGCDAARFWWILHNYGWENAWILDGGIQAWKNAGGDIQEGKELPQVRIPTVGLLAKSPPMSTHISLEQFAWVVANDIVIVDTRSLDEYSGKRQKKGASKGGRIPGSIHVDWEHALNNSGHLKPKEELEMLYSVLKADTNDLIITYCHSGVRSAHTTFVLTEILGYSNVRNYDGSWTEWSYHDLPIEKDSITSIFE